MKEFQLVADWISENYSSANKIIEVGVGKTTEALEKLRKQLPQCTLIATDVRKVPVPEGVKFIRDDVTNPDSSKYREADLIFSLRAPPELYSSLKQIAGEVDADLLVKPVSSEESPSWGKLVNYSGISFHLAQFGKE